MRRTGRAMLAALAILPAAAASAGPVEAARAYLAAHPVWQCGNQAEDFAGKDTNTVLTIRLRPDGGAVIHEETIVYRHPREYRATVEYQAEVRADGGRLVLDTVSARLVRADRLPAGGAWGEASEVHMVLALRPFALEPGGWELAGHSETGLGRILTSCHVPDTGRPPD